MSLQNMDVNMGRINSPRWRSFREPDDWFPALHWRADRHGAIRAASLRHIPVAELTESNHYKAD
jgi:hypothetical protein